MGLLSLFNPPLEKGPSTQDLPERTVKSWQVDPFDYFQSGQYKDRPSSLTYEHLRNMSYRCDIVAAIINTRVNQVAAFAEPQADKYSLGYTIQMRAGREQGSRAAMMRAFELSQLLQTCGIPGMASDGFEAFLRKITRDALTFDQVAIEVVPRNNGLPAFFEAVDAATIRYATQPLPPMDAEGGKDPYLNSPNNNQQNPMQMMSDRMMVTRPDGLSVPAKFVQLIGGTPKTYYADDELYFGIRNPRTDIYANGYGFSELESLVHVITSYLYAQEYNRRIFNQGSMPRGMLNIKGEMTGEQLEAFRRQWTATMAGVNNAWKTPIINAEDIEYVNLNANNKDMEYNAWLQYLIRVACSVFQIDPAEIGFDMPRGLDSPNPMIESSNEAKLRASRDRGLYPLLRFIQRAINEAFIWRIDPDFEFRFVGLNAKSPEQQQAMFVQGVSSYKTLNEVRAEDDLPPLPFGDVPLNGAYISFAQTQQQIMMQQQMMAQQAEQGGEQPANNEEKKDASNKKSEEE